MDQHGRITPTDRLNMADMFRQQKGKRVGGRIPTGDSHRPLYGLGESIERTTAGHTNRTRSAKTRPETMSDAKEPDQAIHTKPDGSMVHRRKNADGSVRETPMQPAWKPHVGTHRQQPPTPMDRLGEIENNMGANLKGPRRTRYNRETGHYEPKPRVRATMQGDRVTGFEQAAHPTVGL